MTNLKLFLTAVGSFLLVACGGGGGSDDGTPDQGGGSGVNAGFTVDCEDAQCKFDGSSSTGSVTSYEWDFGDGNTGSGQTVDYEFSSSGSYVVKLTVKGGGSQDSSTKSVAIETNEKPVAEYGYSCVQLDCFFDGSGSTDDGELQSYEWDFGDGNTGSGQTVDYEFSSSGSYVVKLTVTDDEGLESVFSDTVSVATNSPLGEYKKYSQEMFEGVLFSLDFSRSASFVRDEMIDLAEAYPMLDPSDSSDDVSGACSLGGSWALAGWDDADSSGEVNGNEFVRGGVVDCKIDPSMTAVTFPNDSIFDLFGFGALGNAFLEGNTKIGVNESFEISGSAGGWSVVTTTNLVNYFNSDGSLNTQSYYSMDLSFADIKNPFAGVSGTWGALYAPAGLNDGVLYQTSSLELDGNGDNPVFVQENGAYVMKQGAVVSSYYNEHPDVEGSELLFNIRLTVGSDPAYIVMELDENGDGSFDKIDRFLQSDLIKY